MTGTEDDRRRDVQTFWKAPRPKRKRRSGVKRVSVKRESKRDAREVIRQAVIARDGGCVLHGETDRDCTPPLLTVHHRRKASACGYWSLANLVTLCGGHNVDIEDRPAYYRERWPWLIVREGDPEWKRLGP